MALPGAPENMNQEPGLPPPGPGPAGIDPSLIDPKATEYARSDPEGFGRDMVDNLGQADPNLVLELRNALAGMQLPAEVIDALLTMIDVLLQDPANYQQNRQMFIDEGVPQEFLPPNFDPIFLTGMQMALSEMNRTPQPRQFANGGIAELRPIAKMLSEMGRNGDTMLAHITPKEARLLRVMGGSGTTNPYTGLPEYFNPLKEIKRAVTGTAKAVGKAVSDTAKAVGSVVKGAANVVKAVVKPVANVVKKIAQNPIGRIALTIAAVYFMGPAGLNVAGTMGLTGATALGVNTALASTAVNLASGQSLKESLKGGAISGLTAGVVSSVFPSTLPEAYRAGPAPLAAPVSAADYGASVDALDAYNASGVAVAPDVSSGIPVAGAAPAAAGAASAAGPASLTATEADDLLAGLRTEAPTVQLSAQGPTPISVPTPQVAPVTTPSLGQPLAEGLAGNVSPDVSFGTGAGAIPTAGDVAGGLTDAGVSAGTAANISGGTLAGTGAATTPPSLLDRGIGAIRTAYDTVTEPIKNIYNEYISPSRGMPTTEELNNAAANIIQDAKNAGSSIGYKDALDMATKQLTPSLISQYAPMAALGTAALAASGAFTPKQPPPPGIVDQTYMRGGAEPIPVNLGEVRTVTAPNIGYGSTDFYNIASGYSPMTGGFGPPQFTVRRPEEYLDLSFLNQRYARGGIASINKPRTYPRKTGAINGPGTETSDSIPALLSDGEFVFTAKAVRGAGGGSRRAGAKRMYAMMKALEKKANG